METIDIRDRYGNKTGKIIERGKPLAFDEFFLIVDIWIINQNGEFLVSKRAPTKEPEPDKWEPTCGCAISGEESKTAALREVKEELGIILNPQNGILFKRMIVWDNAIIDVWLFRQDVDIESIILQPDETDDVMWATKVSINQLIEKGDFLSDKRVPYINEIFTLGHKS